MPPLVHDLLALLGLLLRVIGFLALGFVLARLFFEHFKLGSWQLQAVYVLGFFGLIIGVLAFSSASGAGAFALGIAIAYFTSLAPRKAETPVDLPPREVV